MPAGRPRKPSAIRKLTGETRPSQINAHEPQPKLVLPPPPRGLDRVAKSEWIRAAKILRNMRVLTEADLAVLKGYCVNFSYADACEAQVAKQGITVTEYRGSGENAYSISKENPAFTAGIKARKQELEFMRELGLTPASRTRVQSAPEDTRAPLEQLRNRLREIKGGKS